MSSEISEVVGTTISSLPPYQSLQSEQKAPSQCSLLSLSPSLSVWLGKLCGNTDASGPSLTVMLLYSSSNMSKKISSP